MAVGAEEPEILEPVIATIPVDVIELQRDSFTHPAGPLTAFASTFLHALLDETSSQLRCRYDRTTDDQVLAEDGSPLGKASTARPPAPSHVIRGQAQAMDSCAESPVVAPRRRETQRSQDVRQRRRARDSLRQLTVVDGDRLSSVRRSTVTRGGQPVHQNEIQLCGVAAQTLVVASAWHDADGAAEVGDGGDLGVREGVAELRLGVAALALPWHGVVSLPPPRPGCDEDPTRDLRHGGCAGG